MGRHPVPGTKGKEEVVEVEVEVVEEEQVVVEEKETDETTKSWQEVVAAAGGLLMVKDVAVEDLQGVGEVGDQPAIPGGEVGEQPAGPGGEVGNLPLVATATKKKTPLQYRLEQPKRMAEEQISNSNKKMFKESWNTDKSRFEKRQVKYNRPQNFLIILEDNIHQGGEKGAKTGGKLMAFGRGALKHKFIKEGIHFDPSKFFMHANAHNFTEEEVIVPNEQEEVFEEVMLDVVDVQEDGNSKGGADQKKGEEEASSGDEA